MSAKNLLAVSAAIKLSAKMVILGLWNLRTNSHNIRMMLMWISGEYSGVSL